MASFVPYLVTVICGIEMLLILGIGLTAGENVTTSTTAATVTTSTTAPPGVDNCLEIQKNFTWMIQLNDTNTFFTACKTCVMDQENYCGFVEVGEAKEVVDRFKCARNYPVSQFTNEAITSLVDCNKKYGPQPNTTTTPAPTSTTTTTVPTSPTTTTTVAPAPNTTTSATTTLKPTPNVTTTAVPAPTTTTRPTPAPSGGGGFSFANFIGGIIFTLAVSSLAYVAWRFYRARNPNYHTF